MKSLLMFRHCCLAPIVAQNNHYARMLWAGAKGLDACRKGQPKTEWDADKR